MELNAPSFYEFGPFRLEPTEHRLTRDGQQVPLAPKTFELLVYLVENHGRLVIKDQIMQTLWLGSFVEEANLTVSISTLRKALGERDGGVQYIETVPKKGYRFSALVREVKNPEVIPMQLEELPKPAAISPLAEEDARESSNYRPVLEPAGAVRHVSRRRRIVIVALAILACLVMTVSYFFVRRTRAPLSYTPPRQRSLAILPLRNLR